MHEGHGSRAARPVAAVALLAGMAWAAPAAAAGECFLRVDGVTGDCADARHKGEIGIVTWWLAMTNAPGESVGASGPAGGCADFQSLRITQRLDRVLPVLVQLAAAGQHAPGVYLTCRRPRRDAGDYLKVTLSDEQAPAGTPPDGRPGVLPAPLRIGRSGDRRARAVPGRASPRRTGAHVGRPRAPAGAGAPPAR